MTRPELSQLNVEVEFFDDNRMEWVKEHRGEYALVQDKTCHGFFFSWESALKEGLKLLGVQRPFLVKEVLENDRVYFIGGIIG